MHMGWTYASDKTEFLAKEEQREPETATTEELQFGDLREYVRSSKYSSHSVVHLMLVRIMVGNMYYQILL